MKSLDNFSSIEVATLSGYILKYFGPMSHLKLQKLLYYCQAYHLAYFEKPLFEDDFQAWVHGPVCRSIYDTLKGKSVLYSDVDYSKYDFDYKNDLKDLISSDQFELVNDVLDSLANWTGMELESATHKETPWIEARAGYSLGDICDVNISKKTMLNYYKKEING